MALPSLGALAIEPLYATADTIIIGRLGTTELAGLAIAAQILILLTALVNFLAYATTQRVAQHRGARRPEGVISTARHALGLALGIGGALTVFLLITGATLSAWLGARDAVHEVAVEYLTIRAIGLPAMLWALAAHGILRGVRDMVSPLRIVAIAAAANVVIELVMVFGFGWGVAGAAWSTVIVQWAAVAAYARVLSTRLRTEGASHWLGRIDRREVRALLSAGGWLMLRVAALLAALTVATGAAARRGDSTLAAHQVLGTVFMVAALSLDALAIPAQTLIAEATGAKNAPAARHIAARINTAARRAGVAMGALVALGAVAIPVAFSADPLVRSEATGALFVLAVLLVPGAAAFAWDGILIGAGRYRGLGLVMLTSLGIFLAALGLVSIVGVPGGLSGVWAALGVWMLGRAVLTRWIGRF